mmetsp:Transcript_17584/g.45473  ORF Transcript_17584/g.45473 Transcript_17584/m.45473 type:complete len:264 (-) Transcript_17584:290-1081(-)
MPQKHEGDGARSRGAQRRLPQYLCSKLRINDPGLAPALGAGAFARGPPTPRRDEVAGRPAHCCCWPPLPQPAETEPWGRTADALGAMPPRATPPYIVIAPVGRMPIVDVGRIPPATPGRTAPAEAGRAAMERWAAILAANIEVAVPAEAARTCMERCAAILAAIKEVAEPVAEAGRAPSDWARWAAILAASDVGAPAPALGTAVITRGIFAAEEDIAEEVAKVRLMPMPAAAAEVAVAVAPAQASVRSHCAMYCWRPAVTSAP